MNTRSFDNFGNHDATCPICQRSTKQILLKSQAGLFSCPYCQQRLVVCHSGHYVRDPFGLKQIVICSTLRRQSSPLARIMRDFIILKRPVLSVSVGVAVFMGIMTMAQQNTNYRQEIPSTEKVLGMDMDMGMGRGF